MNTIVYNIEQWVCNNKLVFVLTITDEIKNQHNYYRLLNGNWEEITINEANRILQR